MGSRPLAMAVLSLLKAAAGVVCLAIGLGAWPGQFALAQAPATDFGEFAAKAITVTGQVSVLRDNQQWGIFPGDQVRAKELIFTGPDGQAHFEVSDGSTFDVYPNSRVVFRKNVPNWRDMLDLLVGRVKVHIQHWGDQPNHNRVLTPTAVISVRGTTFDVSVDEDDETTMVEVEEGTVEVRHALLPSNNPRMVNAGETLLIYRNVPIASGRFDKGEFFKRAARFAVDALNTLESRARVGGTSPGTVPGTGSGDTKKPPPPPPPPPPAPPGASGGFEEGAPSISPNISVLGTSTRVQTGPQTAWQKVTHGAWSIVKRLVFGESDADQLRRAVGHH